MTRTGLNVNFPIYDHEGMPFYGLVLHKATATYTGMSLADSVTGTANYHTNTLAFTMKEYVMCDGVPYVLVNPPTVKREGMLVDNGDLKGMTQYTFTFYHPMYMLGNMPFTDVAVSSDEENYKGEDKTFSWMGTLVDYVDKLNKNLDGTQWVVEINTSSVSLEVMNKTSEVMTFTDEYISEVLKRGYETWGVPYVVDMVDTENETTYVNEGKVYKVVFGLPSQEVIDETTSEPYVFSFGKGVGLKNDSRTPRNNKIVTRLSGYGSEDNIPYGYPQIPWYGSSQATETPDGYPIYEGIMGGAVVKLINHPFTRKYLMPSVYVTSLFNKVSPYIQGGGVNINYDPTLDLVDYYDADSTYPNPINLQSPSYEIHRFEDIKPCIRNKTLLEDAVPLDSVTLQPTESWDDAIDDDGNYLQPYFSLTLPSLGFDLYACASITQSMKISMRDGSCIGCTFDVQVDWDDYRRNFYDSEGAFSPQGPQRDFTTYPDSTATSITLMVKKDIETFGIVMPNVWQQPKQGDAIVILGISLPTSYITEAQEELDDAMTTWLRGNNIYYYDYPLKFDEHFLATRTDLLSQIKVNTIVRFLYAGSEQQLYVKQMDIKYGEQPLPQYDITLTDDIELVLNPIGRTVDAVSKLSKLVENIKTSIKEADIPALLTNSQNTRKIMHYVEKVMETDTEVLRGLILTSLLAVRDEDGIIQAGISGITGDNSIAAWYGGPMVDHEDMPGETAYAKSLIRHDGSGYFASGDISWGQGGDVSIKGHVEAQSGTFEGFLRTTFHEVGGSDWTTTMGGRLRYVVTSRYANIKVDGEGITAKEVALPDDASFIGVRIIIHDVQYSFTRFTNPLHVVLENGEPFTNLFEEDDPTLEDIIQGGVTPVTDISFIDGVVELLGVECPPTSASQHCDWVLLARSTTYFNKNGQG